MKANISLSVNGVFVQGAAEPRRSLLDFLRNDLGLTGTKRGCDGGECWSCAVLVDGKAAMSCRLPLERAAGKNVITIEGLAGPEGLHPIQTAFIDAGAVQCGFCTPGLIISTKALLDRNPSPRREDIVRALSKHICRCTGYIKIVDAVMLASKRLQGLQTAAVNRTGVVGSSVARTDAGSKVLGAAQFGADLNRKDQLYARVFRSDRHHARVLSVDVSQAVAVPGVEAVLTAPDVPGSNRIGYVLRDQPVLAGDKVRRIGDPIAVVAAATEESAAAALGKIRVEYESLPPVLDPSEAIRPGAVAVHEQGNVLCRRYVVRGSVEDGFDRADVIVEDTYVTPFAEHAYLEPEAGLAFLDEKGRVVVQSSTQNPVLVQNDVAHALGLRLDQVRAIPSVIGGGFGGKLDAGLEVLLALVAFKLRKPVKMVFSRSESFLASIKKHPFRIQLRLGATSDGKFVALQGRLLADGGAYASASTRVLGRAVVQSAGCYAIPNVSLEGMVAYTNNPPAGPMRGYGANQACFAIESLVDKLASELGIDPLELRTMNMLSKGSTTITGHVIGRDLALRHTLDAIRPYYEKARRWRERQAGKANLVRGIGVACYTEGLGSLAADPGDGSATAESQTERGVSGFAVAEAEAELLADGRICVYTGAVELGQGSLTALAQIAAQETGQPLGQIVVISGDTALTLPAGSTSGSRTTYLSGYAVRSACHQLVEAILGSAGAVLGQPTALEVSQGFVCETDNPLNRISLSALAQASGRSLKGRGLQPQSSDPLFGVSGHSASAQLAQVEVNVETGEVRVVRLVSCQDVGKAINPLALEGQIEGGLVMGLGLALKEEFVPGETHGFREYQVPRLRDVPEIVPVIVEVPDEYGPFGAKGMGEHTLIPTLPAITNALADATGVRILKIPVEKSLLIGKAPLRRKTR